MESWELIKLLKEGKILGKQLNKSEDTTMFVVCDPESGHIEAKGWGSALWTPQEVIFSIVREPKDWKVIEHSGEYPYPWSSTYKQKNDESG
jgi:hypothetical protein